MPDIAIRPAAQGDLDFISSCAAAAYGHYVSRIGKKPAPMTADYDGELEHTVIIKEDSVPRRFAIYFPHADHMFLENIAIDPTGQGKGLGRILIHHIEEETKRAGLCAIELYTNETMTENLSYYPKLGFIETGRRTEDGFNRVFFRKEL